MIILGIDPGTTRVGYGVLESVSGEIKLKEAGLLKIKIKNTTQGAEKTFDFENLSSIKNQTDRLIRKFKPQIMAVEKLFFARNQKTGMAVAQARGVILLSALENKIKIEEYSPNEIKTAVTGYGLANKKAVLKMVKLILKEPKLKVIDDASDALAVAILACEKCKIADYATGS